MSDSDPKQLVILMADDNPDDVMLIREALEEGKFDIDLRSVPDGGEAMDYLLRRGWYEDPELSPRPDLILLDLKMPVKDGIETLKDIRDNPEFREIPVVILTTSRNKDLLARTYKIGASSFITKPITFGEIRKTMDSLCSYWFKTVSLPDQKESSGPEPRNGIEGSE